MAQFILSITTGTPEYDFREHVDHCLFTHINQVFDGFSTAKSAFRCAISSFSKDNTDIRDPKGQKVLNAPGLLRFDGELVGLWKKSFDYLLDLTHHLLSDPHYECEQETLRHISKVEHLDPGYVMHCDEDTILIALDAPAVAVQHNIHNMSKEHQYYYLSVRIGGPDKLGEYEAYYISLCPIGGVAVQDKQYPLLESLRREKELIKRASIQGG